MGTNYLEQFSNSDEQSKALDEVAAKLNSIDDRLSNIESSARMAPSLSYSLKAPDDYNDNLVEILDKLTTKKKEEKKETYIFYAVLAVFVLACIAVASGTIFGAYQLYQARQESTTRAVLTGQAPDRDGVQWYKEHFPQGVTFGKALEYDGDGNPTGNYLKDENGNIKPVYDIEPNITIEQWPSVRKATS